MPDSTQPGLLLSEREGLPDALRALVEEFPREIWEGHSNFNDLTRFWMDKHIMFRRLLDRLRDDAEEMIDGKLDFAAYAPRLNRFGGHFVGNLHGHHHIEDDHYFPLLVGLDPLLQRGFAILDADHHALVDYLERFTTQANAVLSSNGAPAGRTSLGQLHETIGSLETVLNRHLLDEEDLVVPSILKYGMPGE